MKRVFPDSGQFAKTAENVEDLLKTLARGDTPDVGQTIVFREKGWIFEDVNGDIYAVRAYERDDTAHEGDGISFRLFEVEVDGNGNPRVIANPTYAAGNVSGTVTLDADNGPTQSCTLTANGTLQVPSNLADGEPMVILITTGGFTLTFNGMYISGGAPSGLTGLVAVTLQKCGSTVLAAILNDMQLVSTP